MRTGVRVALDLGSVRIGVAKSDATGTLASPYTTWQVSADWMSELGKLIAEYEPIELIIGLPTNLRGESSVAAEAIKEIATEIKTNFPLQPIRLMDERMTTAAARKQLQAAGYNSRSDKHLIDAAAATVLLEDALEAERRQGKPAGESL